MIKDIIRDTAFIHFLSSLSSYSILFLYDYLDVDKALAVRIFINYSFVFFGFILIAFWTETKTLKHLSWVGFLILILSLHEAYLSEDLEQFYGPVLALIACVLISWKVSNIFKN